MDFDLRSRRFELRNRVVDPHHGIGPVRLNPRNTRRSAITGSRTDVEHGGLNRGNRRTRRCSIFAIAHADLHRSEIGRTSTMLTSSSLRRLNAGSSISHSQPISRACGVRYLARNQPSIVARSNYSTRTTDSCPINDLMLPQFQHHAGRYR